jgi:predicted Zn finger-like uncharacterized protein
MFKVVPDQLRVSDGWVRCGQCNEVFDANSNLQPRAETARNSIAAPLVQESTPVPVPVPPPPPPPPPPIPKEQPVERVIQDVVQPTADVEAEVSVGVDPKHVEPIAERSTSSVVPAVSRTVESDPSVSPRALQSEPKPEALVSVAARQTTLGDQRITAVRRDNPKRVRKGTTAQKPEEPLQHSFLATGKVSSTASKPWVRVVFWILSTVLTIVLAVQIVVHERDRIATTMPSAQRALEPLCAALGCKILPLRQIESIVIDSSSFAKTRPDVYRLNFTLKNIAQISVATPSVELTLTDIQDQAVLRRVFVTSEFGRQQKMEPGAELTASLAVAVKPGAGSAKVSGYRLLSFYP